MFDELAPGVFRRRYESLDINIGVVLSDEGVLIVDTRASHLEADALRDELRSLTRHPVRWVVDTHWHWDHTFGNSRFPDAEIWGHARCREAMLARGDSMKADAIAWLPDRQPEIESVEITPPSSVFTGEAEIDLGSMAVTLQHHGPGHTDADIVIRVEDRGVVFVGDLLEEGSPPYFDDSYPLRWPGTLRSVLSREAAVFVPGHGDVMHRFAALAQMEELEVVADLARLCIDEGMPVDEAARRGPYPLEVMMSALGRALEVGDLQPS